MVRLTDRTAIFIAVDLDVKQQNKQNMLNVKFLIHQPKHIVFAL